jgi:hypothetical protein
MFFLAKCYKEKYQEGLFPYVHQRIPVDQALLALKKVHIVVAQGQAVPVDVPILCCLVFRDVLFDSARILQRV